MKKVRSKPATADSENPEWTNRDFAGASRVWEIPELAHLSKRRRGERGAQKAPTKRLVTLRLDRDVVDRFRSTGPGWQSRINDTLRKARISSK